MNNYIESKNWILIKVVAIIVTMLVILGNSQGDLKSSAAFLVVVIGALSVIKVKNNWFLIIIYSCILYCNYSICFANYFRTIDSVFSSYANSKEAVVGINILLLFSLLLFLITPRTPNIAEYRNTKKSITVNNRSNTVIVYILLAIIVLVLIYGFQRPSVAGERGTPSTLYEYSIVFVIMGFMYSGQKKLHKWMFTGATLILAMQNFVYGGRITGIQLGICLVLCVLIDKLDVRWVIPAGFMMLVIMTAIGQFRGSFSLNANSLSAVWDTLKENGLALDTAFAAYYTSMLFIRVLSYMTIGQRLHLFFRWILSIVGGGAVADSNLAEYIRIYFFHYGGGVLPFFAYFYLGVAGIMFLVLYLRILFKRIAAITSKSSSYWRCVAVYLASTTFRWYLYSPSQLFRGVLLLSLVYLFLNYLDMATKTGIVSLLYSCSNGDRGKNRVMQ